MTASGRTRARKQDGGGAAAYNHYGQKIGSKGERTRQLLIDATVRLLDTRGLRDVSVADVARAATTSPATFYVYFRDVPEVVLAALETAHQTSPELEALIRRDWLAPGAAAGALAFVQAYTDLWNQHRIVFRVRNLAAEEGDARFYQARMQAAGPMMQALVEQIARAQEKGLVPPDITPRACGGTLLMMLERLSAIGPLSNHEGGPTFAELKAAAAHMLANMLGAKD